MENSLRKNSVSSKRPHSSCGPDLKSNNLATKNFFIRDNYKQKLLQQRQIDLAMQKKYNESLQKRSEKRFWNSPFGVNILAESEIQEHERKMVSRTKKAKSLSKNFKKSKGKEKYLNKLREEIKKKDAGKGYLEEIQISSILLAKQSDEKLKKAKKNRQRYIYETFIPTTSAIQRNTKQGNMSHLDRFDFLQDIDEFD